MNAILPLSVIIAVGALTVGCASSSTVDDSSNTDVAATTAATDEPLQPYKPSGAVTCRYEKPIGSHMMRKICTSVEDDERNQKRTRDLLRSGRLPKSKEIGHTTRER